MNDLHCDWSNVLLLDSLTKQPRRQSRRLLSKLRKNPTGCKATPFQRIFGAPKTGRKITSRVNKTNNRKKNEWKEEYDTWNMLTETLNRQLVSTHQIHRGSNDIGIFNNRTNNHIQLIRDRQQFNRLMLIGSDGVKIGAKHLIDPFDSDSSIAFKLKFRLIPVIEGITVANHYAENSYRFDDDRNDNHIDETDLNAVEAVEAAAKMTNASETGSTILFDMESSVKSIEFTDMYEQINTTVNISEAPTEYSEFIRALQSTDVGNAPLFSTPKK